MRFMKALVGVAVLSGTTLVTTGAFSQSTDRLSQNTEPSLRPLSRQKLLWPI